MTSRESDSRTFLCIPGHSSALSWKEFPGSPGQSRAIPSNPGHSCAFSPLPAPPPAIPFASDSFLPTPPPAIPFALVSCAPPTQRVRRKFENWLVWGGAHGPGDAPPPPQPVFAFVSCAPPTQRVRSKNFKLAGVGGSAWPRRCATPHLSQSLFLNQ